MKKSNKVIKQFLHLKEDYNLDLSEDKKDSQIILEDDSDKEEADDKESSIEKDDVENKEEPKKDSEENKKKDSEEKDDEESVKINKEPKVATKINYKINVSSIYSKMQSAKSPTDVALTLKEFLDTVETSSLEALTQKEE